MQTADQIIETLGNTTAVATALGLTPSTVQSWKEANFIPDWRQDALLSLARRLNKPLAASDFPPVEKRISRKPATSPEADKANAA